MFTGIIQGQGEILHIERGGSDCRFRIRPLFSIENVIDGESIAVNGACLSVERHTAADFVMFASAETLARTTLGLLKNGDLVNLERALAVGDRLGGHIVSGHVDCVATVGAIGRAGRSVQCRILFPGERAGEVIPKGSVALDGISLTINACGDDFLEVNIIPDTQKRTTMSLWKVGSRINMETDIIGKYVRRMVSGANPPPAETALPHGAAAKSGGIDMDTLIRKGFI